MREGLRSSALSMREKARADFYPENVNDGGRKRLNLNSDKLVMFNESSPCLLRSKGQKERESERVECERNTDAGSDKTGDAECDADVEEKGFSVVSSGLESARDLVASPESNVEENGSYDQVACSNYADHVAKEERESSPVPNGLDPCTKKEIKLSSLIPNQSSIISSSVLVTEGKVEENVCRSELAGHEKDADGGVCLIPMNVDEVVFSNGDEEKVCSTILGNSLLAYDSEIADACLDADKTRHEHDDGLQGFEREDLNCPRQDDVITSDIAMTQRGPSLNLNDRESTPNAIISSVKENFERSENKLAFCLKNRDGELAVNSIGDACEVAEKVEIDDSQMGGNSAASKYLKEEVVSPPASIVLDSAQELVFSITDMNVEATSGSQHMECVKDADAEVHDDKVTVSGIDGNANGDIDEGMLRLGECKRVRKRKKGLISECDEDDGSETKKVKEGNHQYTKRVLRSRTTIISGGNQEVDSGSNGCVLGGKRKTKTEYPDPDELHVTIDETDQQIQRPGKKLKCRGGPPKAQEQYLPSTLHHEEEMKDTVVSCTVKFRGRPPKVKKDLLQSKLINKNNLKNMVAEIVTRRGRPPKVPEENLTSQASHKSKSKDMVVYKKLKRRGRPPKVREEDLAPQVLKKKGMSEALDDKRKVKGSEKNSDQTEAKDACIGHNAGKSIVKKKLKTKKPKDEVDMGRREQKQLVRDQINSMILNAGWKIDYRLRQSRDYHDAVYLDTEGKTYWSSTKAYRFLKKRIEDGVANGKEIAAFTIIPEEAFSTLFRHTGRERPKKGKKGKKANNLGKGEKGTKINKLDKKGKDEAKRKAKVKGDRSLCKKQVASSLKGRSKPRLLARSSEKGSNQDSDGFMPFSGKRSLLSWMIDLGTIVPGWKVHYGCIKRKMIKREGTINRDGIHCRCCEEIMSISDFEAHAGGKLLGQPFKNIFLDSGTSLWQCMLDSWGKEEELRRITYNSVDVKGDDPNDDTCNICADGGDLICCDGCPSTFHQSCLDIQNFPSGKWHCVYCSCKFCGMAAVNNPPTDDCPDPIVSELLSCNLCEEKFHQHCSQREVAVNVDSVRPSFCGKKCQEIFERLQMSIGVRHELEEGFSWTLLHCSGISQDLSADDDDALKVEHNSKLAVAFSIMDECFVPIIDERSGINIIQNVVYNCGSNCRRLNYSGFFTAILERGDEIISAASIRIHGNQIAEMPFIGTRNLYRRQGMCRRLLNAIESALGSLDVENLVIPAITELFQTWTSVFGFKPLEEHKRKGLKCMSLIVFPGTDMLEKPLLNVKLAEGNTITATDEQEYEQQTVSNTGSDSNAFSKIIDGNSNLQLPDEFLNDTPKHTDLSLSYGDNPPRVSNDCSYDNGHAIPANANTSTKAHSSCATLVLDDITMEMNHPSKFELDYISLNEAKCEHRPVELPGECGKAIDKEVTREVGNMVNSEQLHFSGSHPDYTSGPSTLASVVGELSKSVEVQSSVDNDGIMELKASSLTCSVGDTLELTSAVTTKVTFDLNKDLAAAETDSDCLPVGPQLCAKAYEFSDSGAQVDKPAGNLCDSDSCTTQALMLV